MRKYTSIIVLVLTVLPFLSFGQNENEPLDPLMSWELQDAFWQNFNEPEQAFKITTPGDFIVKSDTIEVAIGSITTQTFYFQPPSEKAENEMYMVMSTNYPVGMLPKDSVELIQLFLKETEDAAVDAVHGELMFSQQGILDNYPYRYWRVDYLNGRASIRTKAILVENRLYTVQTVTRREYGINHSTDRFIDSFRFFTPKSLIILNNE